MQAWKRMKVINKITGSPGQTGFFVPFSLQLRDQHQFDEPNVIVIVVFLCWAPSSHCTSLPSCVCPAELTEKLVSNIKPNHVLKKKKTKYEIWFTKTERCVLKHGLKRQQYHTLFDTNPITRIYISTTVVPNPRAPDRYRSMGHLVQRRRQKKIFKH